MARRSPGSVRGLEDLGRIRLSKSIFFRECLHSEIAGIHGLSNVPDDVDLAVAAGTRLCADLLEPIQANFGRISIRSAYRSLEVNTIGNAQGYNCATNRNDRARHIWDQRSADGGMGAMATIVVPWLLDQEGDAGDWRRMAWWIHDHLPYSELQFFPRLKAFNIGWHEFPKRRIASFVSPRGVLTKSGMPGSEDSHDAWYAGFPSSQK